MSIIENGNKWAFLIYFLIFLVACNGNKNTNLKDTLNILPKAPLPDISPEVYCDSLRARTYADLRRGTKELVTDNFPQDDINKTMLFEKILKSKFHLKLLPIFDSIFYPRCIVPIMDSVIKAEYGQDGKAMIIEQVNKLTDSIFSTKQEYHH